VEGTYRNKFVRSVRRSMFKKRNDFEGEPPEVTALREALKADDTKIIIQDKEGNTWTLYNDKLRGCFLAIGRVKVGGEASWYPLLMGG
jgi:hypothetical protein